MSPFQIQDQDVGYNSSGSTPRGLCNTGKHSPKINFTTLPYWPLLRRVANRKEIRKFAEELKPALEDKNRRPNTRTRYKILMGLLWTQEWYALLILPRVLLDSHCAPERSKPTSRPLHAKMPIEKARNLIALVWSARWYNSLPTRRISEGRPRCDT
jgi:hypothetical protein